MHEHIVTRSPGVHENWPHLFERNAILAMAQQKLADLHTRGIRTIVDLTTVALHDIPDDIHPGVRAAGVTADQIEQMLVRNPRAIFEAAG